MTNVPLNNDWTHISVLIDRSGSMESLNTTTISAELTNFIKSQTGGKVTVTAARFDHEYEKFLNNLPASQVNINPDDIKPRGMTALTESLCRLIDDTGKELSELLDERPGKIFVVVLTDGEENSSTGKYSGSEGKKLLKEKITHQKQVYNWVFFFMGTNFDAVTTGQELGIDGRTCINFGADSVRCTQVLRNMSQQVNMTRQLKVEDMKNHQVLYNSAGFTQAQRDNCS
jgi:hypothetical protein